MKKIISLLFATLLIVSCGSSDGGNGNDNKGKTVNAPGSKTPLSTTTNNTTKPKAIPACESGMSVPGCS